MLQIDTLYDTGPGKMRYVISFTRKDLCGDFISVVGVFILFLSTYDWTMKISLLKVSFCMNSSLVSTVSTR